MFWPHVCWHLETSTNLLWPKPILFIPLIENLFPFFLTIPVELQFETELQYLGWNFLSTLGQQVLPQWAQGTSKPLGLLGICLQPVTAGEGSPMLRDTALQWVPFWWGTMKAPHGLTYEIWKLWCFPHWAVMNTKWGNVRLSLHCWPTINVSSLATLLLPSV